MFGFFKKKELTYDSLMDHELDKIINRPALSFSLQAKDKLNFSFESFSFVVILLMGLHSGKGTLSEDKINTQSKHAGSYILYTLQKELGGRFAWDDGLREPVLIVGEPDFFVSISIFSKVDQLLDDGKVDLYGYIRDFVSSFNNAKNGENIKYV